MPLLSRMVTLMLLSVSVPSQLVPLVLAIVPVYGWLLTVIVAVGWPKNVVVHVAGGVPPLLKTRLFCETLVPSETDDAEAVELVHTILPTLVVGVAVAEARLADLG